MYRVWIYIVALTWALISCKHSPQQDSAKSPIELDTIHKANESRYLTHPGLQVLLDSNKLTGSILIYDAEDDAYHTNDRQAIETKHLPASTFKIPNTIIGLETGIIDSNHVFLWDGTERAMHIWEKDLPLKEAFQRSCVPCYQELARQIGVQRMSKYLDQLDFGLMQVSAATIDNFWLIGASQISPLQQIDFLRRLIEDQLPISQHTKRIILDIIQIKATADYSLNGKTGWSIDGENHNGWFVGYIQKNGMIYYFSTQIAPTSTFDMAEFPQIRREITIEAFQQMGIIDVNCRGLKMVPFF